MKTRRTPAPVLAGCQALFLGGMLSLTAAATEAAEMSAGADRAYPYAPAQMMPPGQRPGGFGMGPGQGPGRFGMMPGQERGGFGMASPQGPGQQPGGYGMGPGQERGGFGMAPPQGPGGYGMGPGQQPGGYGMGPGQERGGFGMQPGQEPGGFGMAPVQRPGGYGMGHGQQPGGFGTGPDQGPGGFAMRPGLGGPQSGMMAGGMGGPGSAMLNSIGAMDLTSEQRSQFDAIREQLQTRQQELMDKLRAEGEKMRKLQEEQMRLGQTLTDLRGHMMQAMQDAANRAEELLTEEQRQAMIDRGRHVMMRPGRPGGSGQPGGEVE